MVLKEERSITTKSQVEEIQEKTRCIVEYTSLIFLFSYFRGEHIAEVKCC